MLWVSEPVAGSPHTPGLRFPRHASTCKALEEVSTLPPGYVVVMCSNQMYSVLRTGFFFRGHQLQNSKALASFVIFHSGSTHSASESKLAAAFDWSFHNGTKVPTTGGTGAELADSPLKAPVLLLRILHASLEVLRAPGVANGALDRSPTETLHMASGVGLRKWQHAAYKISQSSESLRTTLGKKSCLRSKAALPHLKHGLA